MTGAAVDDHFWVFAHLGRTPETPPTYHVTPGPWILNDIYEAHRAYLAKHGGVRRPGNPLSTHHSIKVPRIAEWTDRWEILELF